MLLTFIVDPPLCALLGAVFALAYRAAPTVQPMRQRPFRAGLLVLILFGIMMVATYPQYTDWMWGYYFDTTTMSVAYHVGSVTVALVAYALLYCAGYQWITERRRARQSIHSVLIALSGWTVATLLLGWSRFWRIGDYFSVAHGDAPALHMVPFFTEYCIGVAVLAITGTIAWRWGRSR